MKLSRWRMRVGAVVGAWTSLVLSACPNQDLAPLMPCTVSGLSLAASGNTIDKVDVLFVIDNSGSMAEEQEKLMRELPRLVQVLASGDLDGVADPSGKLDFPPVASLHLGVVSSDMGLNGQPAPTRDACPKTFGDEGKLQTSTIVAVQGVTLPGATTPVLPPRSECASVNVPRFIDFTAKQSSAMTTSQQFRCIASLGVQGCGLEQQLESMWRALAPSTDNTFSRGTHGQGAPGGYNTGFLRDDAILAVIVVSDEEDCSVPDNNAAAVFDGRDTNLLNVLCTRNRDKLHNVNRYVNGLKSLKSKQYQDRVIFAGIVGVPTAERTRGLSPDQILALPEMQTEEEVDSRGSRRLRPACKTTSAGQADPARRIVEVAKSFGENGVITSICEDNYGPALSAVIDKIAVQLTGQCLPRTFERNVRTNLVDCTVVEIKGPDDKTPCNQTPGRRRQLASRTVDKTERIVCEVDQLPVTNRTVPTGHGWYYDDFSDEAKRCAGLQSRVQFAASSPLSNKATARIECFRTVREVEEKSKGVAAVNTPCIVDGGDGPHGDAKCAALSLPDEMLLCVNGSCQLSCRNAADCQPGFSCGTDASGRQYCENPTCPVAEQS